MNLSLKNKDDQVINLDLKNCTIRWGILDKKILVPEKLQMNFITSEMVNFLPKKKIGNFSANICMYIYVCMYWLLFCSWNRAIKRKKPALLIPIVPLSFIFAYQCDLGYGTLLQRMKGKSLINPSSYFLIFVVIVVQGPPEPMTISVRPCDQASTGQLFGSFTH